MKVLVNAVSATTGGGLTYIENLLKHLAEEMPEDEFIVYVPRHTEIAAADSLRLLAKFDFRIFPWRRSRGVRRLYFDQVYIPRIARKEGVDVLFSPSGFATLLCSQPQVLLIRNAAYFNELMVQSYREVGRSVVRLYARRFLSFLSLWASDLVLFPSQGMKSMVERHISLDKKWVEVIHYGLDQSRWAPGGEGEPKVERMVARWKEGGFKVILNVASYAVQKNLETLVEAMALLRDSGVGAKLLMTTSREGTADKMEYDRLQERIAALGLGDHVISLGSIPYRDLPALYRSCDAFVFPSLVESFGHPLLESMACGLPTVVSDTPVHRELCGGAAEYFEAKSAEDCAAVVQKVLVDDSLRNEMKVKSLKRVEAFSWPEYVQRFALLVRQLLIEQGRVAETPSKA